jgi:hypothetical protein
MDVGTVIPVGLVLSVVAGLFCWAALMRLERRRIRRNVASALVGEIAAVLEAIDARKVVDLFGRAAQLGDDRAGAVVPFDLGPFSAYEANAGRLDIFDAPLPRKIAFLFSGFHDLAHESVEFQSPRLVPEVRRERAARLARVGAELLELADDVLRSLRPFVERGRRRA